MNSHLTAFQPNLNLFGVPLRQGPGVAFSGRRPWEPKTTAGDLGRTIKQTSGDRSNDPEEIWRTLVSQSLSCLTDLDFQLEQSETKLEEQHVPFSV